MADVDHIQALRELIQKRFIELATEMPLKSRRALKEILDQLVTEVAALRESAKEAHRAPAPSRKAAASKTPKKTAKKKR